MTSLRVSSSNFTVVPFWKNYLSLAGTERNIIAGLTFTNAKHDPEQIFNTLKLFKKEVYSPNDRIAIQFFTEDFYLPGESTVGIYLYNIFLCIAKLDIPIWVILFVTNKTGLLKEITWLTRNVCNDFENLPDISICHFHTGICPEHIEPVEINIDAIEKKYMFLARGAPRLHRLAMLCDLENDNLLSNGLVSWGNFDNQYQIVENSNKINYQLFPLLQGADISETNNWESSNLSFLKFTGDLSNHWHYCDNNSALSKYKNKFIETAYTPIEVEMPAKFNGLYSENTVIPSIKKSFLYISGETTFHYPVTMLTEKSFRPLYSKRPFVILGAPNSLKILREMYGFKTFDQWWDESYDLEQDPGIRYQKVYNIVKQINSYSINELKELCNSMKTVLEYNFEHYANVFTSDRFVQEHTVKCLTHQSPYM